MLTKAFALIAVAGTLVLAGGCKKTESPATSAPSALTKEPWQIKRDELGAAVKVGMSEDEVVKAIGEPHHSKSIVAGTAVVAWEYDLSGGRYFKVRFDKNRRVASAGFEGTGIPIQ